MTGLVPHDDGFVTYPDDVAVAGNETIFAAEGSVDAVRARQLFRHALAVLWMNA